MPIPLALGIAGMQAGGQLISSIIKKKQAEKAMPSLEDPAQAKFLQELRLKRKQLERGVGTSASISRGLAGRQLAQTQRNILRAGGGGGATMSGMAMAQKASGDVLNRMLGEQQKQTGFYTQLVGNLTESMANRKLALQMSERMQKLDEAAKLRRAGGQVLAATAARYLPENINLKNLFGRKDRNTGEFYVQGRKSTIGLSKPGLIPTTSGVNAPADMTGMENAVYIPEAEQNRQIYWNY